MYTVIMGYKQSIIHKDSWETGKEEYYPEICN